MRGVETEKYGSYLSLRLRNHRELVRLTETRYSTLKFYTEEGFLPFQQEDSNLTRRYPREKTVERIAYIKALRNQKKTIPQIKKILTEKDSNADQ